ncbi:hypothetical protein ACFL54_03770 [Planctomycetota bacterium]
MRRGILYLLLAVMVVGIPAGVRPPVAGAQEAVDTLDTLITLDYRDTDLRDIVDYISRRARKTIIIEPDVDEKLTISLIDVPWRKALDLIAKQAAVVVRQEGNTWFISKPPRITMNFRDADIRVVIEIIAKLSNANIVVASDVEGSVNLHLKDVPWDIALNNVIKTANFTLVKEEGNILRVVSPSSLQTQMETEIFQLHYITPPERYKAKIETQFAEYVKPDLSAADDPTKFHLFQALLAIKSEQGAVSYEPAQNIIIAKDTVPVLDQMREVIEKYDQPPRQVFIEVRFVRTTVADVLDYGIDFTNGFTFSNSLGSMVTRLPFDLGQGGFEDNLAVAKEGPSDAQIADYLTGDTAAYTFGTLDFRSLSSTLRLLQSNTNTEIVQAPKLLALDNEEATIFVGETIRFVEQAITSDQFGNPVVTLKEAKSSPVSVGFQLLVRPRVIPDTNQVLLAIIPEFETLTGSGENIEGFDTFISGDLTLDLPRVGSESVVTKMLLEDSQTGVIGGLVNTSTTKIKRKVPFVGDIPILGRLFRFDGNAYNERNLFIFVTVSIVRTQEETVKRLKEKERKRHEEFLQAQVDRLEQFRDDDTNLNALSDRKPSGHGLLSPEEIEELKRKYNIK